MYVSYEEFQEIIKLKIKKIKIIRSIDYLTTTSKVTFIYLYTPFPEFLTPAVLVPRFPVSRFSIAPDMDWVYPLVGLGLSKPIEHNPADHECEKEKQ